MATTSCVLHLVPWAEVGGTERLVQYLCRAGTAWRHAVAFPRGGPAISDFRRENISTFILPPELEPKNRKRAVEAYGNFDLVHAHIMEVDQIPHALTVARTIGKPGLLTLHARRVLPPLPWPLVCVSESIAQLQSKNIQNTAVIPNGVRVNAEPSSALKRSKGQITLTIVARERRVAPMLWESLEMIDRLGYDYRLLIVGQDGRSTERVQFLGVRRDVNAILEETDIFIYPVLPGAHDLSLLEAMAAGLPCVCTDVYGVKESISHLHDGILVAPDQMEEFVAAVDSLMCSSALRSRLGTQARKTVLSDFDIEQCWAKYHALYRVASDLGSDGPAKQRGSNEI